MAKKKRQKLIDVIIEAALRHENKSRGSGMVDLGRLLHLCWAFLSKKEREAIGIAAFDVEGLDLAEHMRPKKIEFGGVLVQRF